MRSLIGLSALLIALPLVVAAQTITFSNASPAVQIELLANSQLALDAQGNLTAQCSLSANGCQRLTQGGSAQCGAGVTFNSQLTVTNPAPPAPPGGYPGGSQITVGAQMSGAAVCTRDAFLPPSTPTNVSGWNGSITPVNNSISQSVTLPNQANTDYLLRLTCFGSTGSDVRELTVRTADQIIPINPSCPSEPIYTSAQPGETAPTPITGVTRLNIAGFEALRNVIGFNLNPFPSTGTQGNLLFPWTTVRVIQFQVPNPFPQEPFSRRFQFASWPNGFNQSNEGYISISNCPGDLRIPTSSQNGTAASPTYAEGCRNWRGLSWAQDTGQFDLPYIVGTLGQPNLSTPGTCVLVPGQTYYMNMYLSKPDRVIRNLIPPNPICLDFNCGHAVGAGG